MIKLQKNNTNKVFKYLLLSSLFLMPSCANKEFNHLLKTNIKDPLDREVNLSREEFKEVLRPYKDSSKLAPSTLIKADEEDLNYSPVILAPEDPSISSAKLVTMSITEDVPIKDVLMELARLSDLELALDPNIEGGIILKVKDRPVKDVIEIVADQASLRYSIENGILRIQKDGAYLVSYKVDYINLTRSSKGSFTSKTNLLSDSSSSSSSGSSSSSSGSSGSNGDSAINSGSSHEISTDYDGDNWKSIEDNVNKIILLRDQELYKGADGKVEVANNTTGQPVSYYTINKQAGIINVMADSKKHKSIKKYLDSVKVSLSAQVLIEAKIVEVSLDEQYAAGIDWASLQGKDFRGTFSYAPDIGTNFFSGLVDSSQVEHRNKLGGVDHTLKLLEGFGTVRTLSNPRINAINNQQAVLSFAVNKPYFTVSGTLEQTQTTNGTTSSTPPTITSTLHSVPIGVILTLQPSIDLETQEVTMNIRPTLTTDTGADVKDPAVQILALSAGGTGSTLADILTSSSIPTIQVKELDTILKARSGEVMVIGGLIKHSDQNTDTGLPLLSRIPILGNLGKQVTKKVSVQETVILLQATIVNNGNSSYHPQDKKVYETFTQDTRPLTF